ncbi:MULTISPECIES: AAA family ATPase [Methylorubrum]|uniref:AAA family ATPase n=1 Tax=Methylorubrum TaxID=2282523 RepID=UPI00209D73ED|nr:MULTISPECIES: AAA family ATPase [Methylorubrum]MCP1550127.1 putative ATPase [Methylorubrum zatmanii]MCP1553259.1 putative ATPase [Methylorubrum extorquens]MCP1580429.1 putative ATPase [Methylorubrum extorquens]
MPTVREIEAAGYRSLKSIRFPVGSLSVFVGGNGTGKTNLYRALGLLQTAASGRLTRALAAEGGMESVLWAGARRKGEPARVRLSAELADETTGHAYTYAVEVGIPPPISSAAFALEPQVKSERLTVQAGARPVTVLDRDGPAGFVRDEEGRKRSFGTDLLPTETALAALQDAVRFPELQIVRQALGAWRFYHDVRTDAGSPLRRPCLAVTTPTLASDGADLAAVFATLAHIRGDTIDLDAAFADAFPGACLVVPPPEREARFGVIFAEYPKRIFEPSELSDGTLRYLALAGALLAYRLPPFLALNEPETSLHPDLMEPLARMIVQASSRTQVWLVTHSERLAAAVTGSSGVRPRLVLKREGATWIEGLRLAGDFSDEDGEE